jgi:hypothetical protein
MSLSDCPKCWDTLCSCGYEYRNWSIEDLKSQITMLQGVLAEKEEPPLSKEADEIPIDPALLECLLQLVDAVQSRDLVAAEELAGQADDLINPKQPH